MNIKINRESKFNSTLFAKIQGNKMVYKKLWAAVSVSPAPGPGSS